jgi:hypothetical protein
MKTTQQLVTPEMAETWLAKNACNQRKLRAGVVERYARDIKAGQWLLTHQGVAFNTRGELIDGQHRLRAIVLANLPVWLMVSTDVPCNAFSHLDLGMQRTTSDVLRGEGDEWVTADHISIARLLEANGNSRQSVAGRSPFEMKELVYRHRNAITFVLSSIERRVRGVTIGPCLAAIASAYYGEKDRVRLSEFCAVLVSGICRDSSQDQAAIALRDFLKDNMGALSAASRVEMYLKSQRAIRAFMNKEKLTKLFMPSSPVYSVPNGGLV